MRTFIVEVLDDAQQITPEKALDALTFVFRGEVLNVREERRKTVSYNLKSRMEVPGTPHLDSVYGMLRDILPADTHPVIMTRMPEIDTLDLCVSWFVGDQGYIYKYHVPEEIYVGLINNKDIVELELIPDLKKVLRQWLDTKSETHTEGENQR